jgi:hypothetical protein
VITINDRPVFAAEECRRRLPWRRATRVILLAVALTWLLVGVPLLLVLR